MNAPAGPNAAQHEAWNGATGAIWTAWADRFDAGVAAHHAAFLDAAEIAPAEAVLDVGCGAGQTSLDAARAAVNGPVTGVDIAAGLLAIARHRAVEAGVCPTWCSARSTRRCTRSRPGSSTWS